MNLDIDLLEELAAVHNNNGKCESAPYQYSTNRKHCGYKN